jgi:hypothetical protein
LARHGIGERVVAAQIVASANELLSQMLTPEQRGEVQAVSFKGSELLLACKTPAARYMAEGMAKTLGRKLEEEYPNQTFRKVVCVFRNQRANDDEWYNGATV